MFGSIRMKIAMGLSTCKRKSIQRVSFIIVVKSLVTLKVVKWAHIKSVSPRSAGE